MIHFILVHGTFAERAPWTLEGSALRARLTQLVAPNDVASFAAVPWGGRNLTRARLVAADAIATQVKAKSENGEKIFLIGHSHGGSAIAYFLKAYPQVRDRVTGVAFLSTPFIATRLRPQWRLLVRALLISSAMMLLLLILFIVTWLDWNVRVKFGFWASISEFLFYPLALLIGSSLGYFAWRSAERKLLAYLEQKLPSDLDRLATVNIPAGSQIYLRAMGDEAAGLLSMAQFFSWIMSIIGVLASIPIMILGSLWNGLAGKLWGKLVAAAAASLFAFWVCTRFAMTNIEITFCRMHLLGAPPRGDCGVLSTLHYWFTPDHLVLNGYPALKWLLGPVDNVTFILSPLFSAITLMVISYSTLTLLMVSVTAILLALFGWTGLGAALFADFAVEPTPEGSITLVHVDWTAQEVESIFALNHSRTYANPDALDALENWISSHLSIKLREDQ